METGGKCDAKGKSGEGGCFQFMPDTWEGWSKRVLGYVAKQTPVNERFVALNKIQYHLDQGNSDAGIFLIWNQGNAGPCKRGINSKGVPYDSCKYRDNCLRILAMI